MTKTCTFLVGVPASGKSTWIKNNIDRSAVTVLSTDDILEQIAENQGRTYNEVFQEHIGLADKRMFAELDVAIIEDNNIVIDRTNLNKKARGRFLRLLKPHGYTFNAIIFPTPDEAEWRRRLASRPGKTIPDFILKNMKEGFQPISADEGFADIRIIGL